MKNCPSLRVLDMNDWGWFEEKDAVGSVVGVVGSGARKSGYCPRSTRPPAALARAPVDDAESESESRSRSCCGARQSFAIARTGSLLAPRISWSLLCSASALR